MPAEHMTTSDSIYSLCARCDSAVIAASESIGQINLATGPRKRAEWRKEHGRRIVSLDRAVNALGLALIMQPFAADTLSANDRDYATRIHAYACKALNLYTSA